MRSILLVLVTAAAVLRSSLAFPSEPADKVVRVGFVSPQSPSTDVRSVDGFWRRLRELGWVEGQNLIVEARWAEASSDRLDALMREVIERKVDVLVTYSTPGALAAKKATSTIPIVVTSMADPVRNGVNECLLRSDLGIGADSPELAGCCCTISGTFPSDQARFSAPPPSPCSLVRSVAMDVRSRRVQEPTETRDHRASHLVPACPRER